MKWIRNFNQNRNQSQDLKLESVESKDQNVKKFKNTESDIRLFFTDWTDEGLGTLEIEDGFVNTKQNKFIKKTSYIKNIEQSRKAKLVTLNIPAGDGIQIGMEKTMTDIELMSNLFSDIKRFYSLSGEEVNYLIETNFMGMSIKFVVMGDMITKEDSKSDKIDLILKSISDLIKIGWKKRPKLSGNWLEIRTKNLREDVTFLNYLRRIASGEIDLDNLRQDNDFEKKMVLLRNEAWEAGLEIKLSGGDGQIVIKLVDR